MEKHLPEFRGLKLVAARRSRTTSCSSLVEPPRKITIQDLMTHTSGMHCQNPPGFNDLGQKKNRTAGRGGDRVLAAAAGHAAGDRPGSTAGPSFDTLGRVIEVASGKTLRGSSWRERLFRPLGMKDTTFRLTPAQRQRLAVNYKSDSEAPGRQGGAFGEPGTRAGQQGRSTPAPAGGLYSTAADYAALMQMLLDQGKAPAAGRC